MKVFFHFCLFGFSNCYILGTKEASKISGRKEALIIDPGCMDEDILTFIEKNDYLLKGVLITHDHESHVHGLKTLRKIYDVDVFAGDPTVCEQRASIVHDGDILELGNFSVKVFSVPGHSSDSMVFLCDKLLFTGDALSAGLVGSTASSYGTAVQSSAIRTKLFSLPGNYIVLPGHGPPTTLDAERAFNAGLEDAERACAQRAAYVRDIW